MPADLHDVFDKTLDGPFLALFPRQALAKRVDDGLPGAHTVVVTDTDTAGNIANASLSFTLDTTIATPTVALTSDTGSSSSDGITSTSACQ